MSIWGYLLSHQVVVPAKHLPSKLNVRANWTSRNSRDPLDWRLPYFIFLRLIKKLGTFTMDLFVFRLFHQLPNYVVWTPDANSTEVDTMQESLENIFTIAFSPSRLIVR